MVVGFVVVFITPYLLADIGAGLGYIWGGFAFLTSIWAWFFMPELKVSPSHVIVGRVDGGTKELIRAWHELMEEQARNLEEIDQLFEAKIPAWQFQKFQTDGLSHDLAVLERGKTDAKIIEQCEDVERAAPEAVPVGHNA